MSHSSTLARNRKAYHNYFILETLEAGVALLGTEVKSLRAGHADIKESYIRLDGNQIYLIGCHIKPYSHGNITNHEPTRPRKLLLHRKEIERLAATVQEKGLTLVPTKFYLKNRRIKLEIGVAKGKHLHDKRDDLKAKEAKREIARAMKQRDD